MWLAVERGHQDVVAYLIERCNAGLYYKNLVGGYALSEHSFFHFVISLAWIRVHLGCSGKESNRNIQISRRKREDES